MIKNLRFATVYLALAAMMLRALLPTGWMPDFASGGATITVCTMNGPVQLDVDGKARKQNKQDDGHGHDACPFAAAPHFASPATLAAVAAPSLIQAWFALAGEPQAATVRSYYCSASPRAPPFLV